MSLSKDSKTSLCLSSDSCRTDVAVGIASFKAYCIASRSVFHEPEVVQRGTRTAGDGVRGGFNGLVGVGGALDEK